MDAKPPSPSALVTGATGLVGSAVVESLLRRGWSVLTPVRAADDASALARVLPNLPGVPTGRLRAVPGNLARPMLGLDLPRHLHPDIIVHAAADTTFTGTAGGADTNVGGTEEVLRLADHLGVRELHHVSTAFVAGEAATLQPDDRDWTTPARNDYERTKRLAEDTVRAHAGGFRVCIHRPAVVVGNSRTGRTPTYRGIYPLLRLVTRLAARVPAGGRLPLSLQVNADGLRHLIPCDHVGQAIAAHCGRLEERPHEVVHHVPRRPWTNRRLARGLEDALNVRGFEVGDNRGTSHELDAVLAPFGDYLAGEPRFLAAAPGATRGLSQAGLRAQLEFLRREDTRPRNCRRGSAPSVPGLLADYLRDQLLPRLGTELLPGVRSRTASFTVSTDDSAVRLFVRIERGRLVEAGSVLPEATPGDFHVLIAEPMLARLLAAEVDPREAFFDRSFDIEGDVEQALSLAPLVRELLRSRPYQPAPRPEVARHAV